MIFSVLIAAIGIGLAWRFYVTHPEISERLATQFAGLQREEWIAYARHVSAWEIERYADRY